ncbi:hypothetical protein BV20DRAFT_235378 [Pilatotrama ljubarskyi]|nr:hypothetical protein BV20DRAFT_235378 [Pilatotrama ljubarskyi]
MGLLGDLLRLLCALAKYIVSKYICGGSIEEDIYRTPGNPYNADVLPSTVTHRPQVRQQHSPACLQRPPLYPPPPLPPRPAQSHRVQGHSQAEGNTAPTYLPTPPLYPSPPLPPKREQHHRPQEHAQVPGTLRTSPPSVFASAGAELRGEFNRNRVGQRAVHAIELRTRANAASEQKGRSLVEANHAHERGDGVRKREQTNAARTEIERWREHAAKRVLQPYNASTYTARMSERSRGHRPSRSDRNLKCNLHLYPRSLSSNVIPRDTCRYVALP